MSKLQSDWLIGLEQVIILDILGWYCDIANIFMSMRSPILKGHPFFVKGSPVITVETKEMVTLDKCLYDFK
jgi:hypothetical protein